MTISRNDRRSCGGIFEAASPRDEVSTLESLISQPDFWKDQAEAQRLLQRRRRLQDDIDLTESLAKQEADLAVLVEWAGAGEDVGADLESGLDRLEERVELLGRHL